MKQNQNNDMTSSSLLHSEFNEPLQSEIRWNAYLAEKTKLMNALNDIQTKLPFNHSHLFKQPEPEGISQVQSRADPVKDVQKISRADPSRPQNKKKRAISDNSVKHTQSERRLVRTRSGRHAQLVEQAEDESEVVGVLEFAPGNREIRRSNSFLFVDVRCDDQCDIRQPNFSNTRFPSFPPSESPAPPTFAHRMPHRSAAGSPAPKELVPESRRAPAARSCASVVEPPAYQALAQPPRAKGRPLPPAPRPGRKRFVRTKSGRRAELMTEATDESETVGVLQFQGGNREIRRNQSYLVSAFMKRGGTDSSSSSYSRRLSKASSPRKPFLFEQVLHECDEIEGSSGRQSETPEKRLQSPTSLKFVTEFSDSESEESESYDRIGWLDPEQFMEVFGIPMAEIKKHSREYWRQPAPLR